jgi:hypothetical protein
VAEGGGLLNRCTTLKLYPGFESLPHRQNFAPLILSTRQAFQGTPRLASLAASVLESLPHCQLSCSTHLIFSSETLPRLQNSVWETADPAGESRCRAPLDSGACTAASCPMPRIQRLLNRSPRRAAHRQVRTERGPQDVYAVLPTASLDATLALRGTAPSGGSAAGRRPGLSPCQRVQALAPRQVTADRWNLIITAKHPVMSWREAFVRAALEAPEEVRQSRIDPQVLRLYKAEATRR